MLRRHLLSMALAAVWLPVFAVPTAAQTAESPEEFLVRYMAATRAGEWPRVAGMMHPEALEELKTMFAPIAAYDTAGEVLPQLFGMASSAEFTAAPADTIFAKLMQALVQFSPELAGVLSGSTVEPVGHVLEDSTGLTHVVFRMRMQVEGVSMSQLDVAALKQHDGQWRAVLSGDLQGFAAVIRQQLSGEM